MLLFLRLLTVACFRSRASLAAEAVLGISSTTADRHWAYARAWLYNELRREA